MKKDIIRYELIENYLSGKLREEEIREFEKAVSGDTELATELEKQRKLHALISEGSMLEIRDSIRQIHENTISEDGLKKPGNIRTFLAIGVALIITISSIYVFRSQSDQSIDPDATQQLIDSVSDIPTKIDVNSTTTNLQTPEPELSKPIISEKDTSEKETETNSVKLESIPDSSPDSAYQIEKTEVKTPCLYVPDSNVTPIQKNQKSEPGKVVEKIQSIDCSNIRISADLDIQESCSGKATGTIQIRSGSIEGGTPPYQLSIDNGENFYSNYTIEKLYSGMYILWLRDNDNCRSKLGNYMIPSIECSYQHVFAPLKDERWKVPSNGKGASLMIFNQQGMLVFQIQIESGTEYHWEGLSLNENPLSMGIYSFILEFEEGDNLTGTVTIVR